MTSASASILRVSRSQPRAHHRVQRLDAVDAVVEEVGVELDHVQQVVRLDPGQLLPIDVLARDLRGCRPWKRTEDALKNGVPVCFDSATISPGILQAGGQRLVDEHPLARLEAPA